MESSGRVMFKTDTGNTGPTERRLLSIGILSCHGIGRSRTDVSICGLNNYYAKKGISTCYTDSAKALFDEDKRLTAIYNDSIADGKWKGMMSDIHIGYKQWSMPEKNELPKMLSCQ